MIVFINGTFGVGKTTLAERLVKAMPKSILFDPEGIGTAVQNILEPFEKHDDFQHYPEWRKLTIETARQIIKRHKRDLVIPMTIWRSEYFTEVTDGLKKLDPDFRHFSLLASIDIVYDRLQARGIKKGSWAHKQAVKAVPALELPLFAEHVRTDRISANKVGDYILSTLA